MILVRFAGAMLHPRSGEACFALTGQSMAPACGSIAIRITGAQTTLRVRELLHEHAGVGLEFTTLTQREALEKLIPYICAGDVGCVDLLQHIPQSSHSTPTSTPNSYTASYKFGLATFHQCFSSEASTSHIRLPVSRSRY